MIMVNPIIYRKLCPGIVSAASAASTLILDTFTDSDDTLLAAHTPDTDTVGGGWSKTDIAQTGTIEIQSNKAHWMLASGANYFAAGTIDAGEADVPVDLDVTFSTISGQPAQGIILRYLDVDNFWDVTREQTSGDFILRQKEAGVYTERDSSAAGLSAGSTASMQAITSGQSITATVDGANDLSYTSSLFQSETLHGMIGAGRTGGPSTEDTSCDNFQVVG